MTHTFYKYQGTGNDFVIIDNRQKTFDKNNTKLVANLCDRRFGIGADGLILLENHDKVDFKMIYYNSDGNESTMCGNGGRCISAFAKYLGIISNKGIFEAIDGLHEVEFEGNLVKLKMQDVKEVQCYTNYTFLDTGSPHYVTLNDNIIQLDVKTEGSKIRYNDTYKAEGTNVNFVQFKKNNFYYLLPNQQLSLLKGQFPFDVEVLNILNDTIYFELENNITKKIPVHLNIDVKFKLGYNFIDNLKCKPDSIEATGPKKYMDSIFEIDTYPLKLTEVYYL